MPDRDGEVRFDAPRAVVFDLGGTLVEWPDENPAPRWALSYRHLIEAAPHGDWPDEAAYVEAMVAAEGAHWGRVMSDHWSGPPTGLVKEGFRLLGRQAGEDEVMAVLDAYSRVTESYSIVCPDASSTLRLLRQRGYRLGLLSNTWWAADWHDAELATHGLADLLDDMVYTSDLPHSKPHPSVFLEITERLGVDPIEAVMVGDRMLDDVMGALRVGMRAVWKDNDKPWPKPEGVRPTATIGQLDELPDLLVAWGVP